MSYNIPEVGIENTVAGARPLAVRERRSGAMVPVMDIGQDGRAALPSNSDLGGVSKTALGAGGPRRFVADWILDFPETPLDYIELSLPLAERTPANIADFRKNIRNGTNTRDTSDAYKACIEAAMAYGSAFNNIVVKIREPAGAWVWDKKVFVDLDKSGKTNGILIERAGRFASKHYTGPNNKYRFVHKGLYNAATNTPDIKSATRVQGDTWLVEAKNDTFNFGGVASVNVGDRLYAKADGTLQKILPEPGTVRYRGYLDCTTGNPATSFGLPAVDPAQCQFGDTWVVESGGNFLGVPVFRGQEIFFLDRNLWRIKETGAGAYAFSLGERDLATQGFPTNVNPGNYFIVSAPTGRMGGLTQAQYVNGMSIDCTNFRAGDKIGWTGKYWYKFFNSPTPRGGIRPTGSCSKPKIWSSAASAFVYDGDAMGANQGVYGTWLYVMKDTAITLWGAAGPHKEDDVLFFGPNGVEKLGRDPGWDVGMLHFSGDFLDHAIAIRGGHTDISTLSGTTADEGAEQEFNNGILYRFCSRQSPVNDGGLFSDEGALFEDANLSSDDPGSGKAQFKDGMVEKHAYFRGVGGPVMRNTHSKIASGFNREPYSPKYPRLGAAILHTHNCGFVRMLNVSGNARFRTGFWISSDIWDIVGGSDWEGGEFDGSWAECIDGLRLDHGYRNELPCEPTFHIRARDTKSLRHGIIINKHAHVVIQGSVPILEESYKVDGTGLSVDPYPSAILIEQADNVIVSCSIPNGGFDNSGLPAAPADQNPNWRSAFIRIKGTVGTVYVSSLILSMNAGVGIDTTLADRRALAKDFTPYTPLGETLTVSVNDCSIVVDGFTMDGLYGPQRQGYRVLRPVVDPCGIVTTRGVHREGVGPRAPHSWAYTAYSSTPQPNPILSIDRDRSDFAGYASGELGKWRLRGKDSGGTWREVASFRSVWGGNNGPATGSSISYLDALRNGSITNFLTIDGANARGTWTFDFQHTGARVGFFSVPAVARPALTTAGKTTDQQVSDLRAALASLGLVSVS